MPKTVTVAILAYYKDFLDECIESVLAQTYKDIEIIVYDDCSPHNLERVVHSFDDSRLSYIRNDKNLGIHANANLALSLCKTEYIVLFHGDDKMLPWSVEKMAEVLDSMPTVGVVTSSTYVELGSPFISKKPNGLCGVLHNKNELIKRHCLTGRMDLAIQMYRKKTIELIDFRFRVDQFDTYSLFEANNKGAIFYSLNFPLHEYRIHESSSSEMLSVKDWCRNLKKLYDYIVSLDLGYDMMRVRDNYISTCIMKAVKRSFDKEGLDGAFEIRMFLQNELEWSVTDSVFEDAVAIGVLGDYISKVGRREISLSEYYAKQKELSKLGVKIPFMRKVKWFLKYIMYQRAIAVLNNRKRPTGLT